MKVAVINFSGNVGKTTIARHLLAPRIEGAEVIAIESINADDDQTAALRGSQFGELQEYLQTVDSVVVDIGASNVEDLLSLMRKYGQRCGRVTVALCYVEWQLPVHAVLLSIRFSSRFITSRITNFWIFPVMVMGKASTNLM
jgi:hypothetical protein